MNDGMSKPCISLFMCLALKQELLALREIIVVHRIIFKNLLSLISIDISVLPSNFYMSLVIHIFKNRCLNIFKNRYFKHSLCSYLTVYFFFYSEHSLAFSVTSVRVLASICSHTFLITLLFQKKTTWSHSYSRLVSLLVFWILPSPPPEGTCCQLFLLSSVLLLHFSQDVNLHPSSTINK